MPSVSYYTADAVRELDRLAIEEYGIPGFTLMQRAGRATFNVLRTRWPQTRRLDIFCGTGNNGGDGCIVASLAAAAGLPATIWLTGEAAKMRGDARRALDEARAREVPVRPAEQCRLAQSVETVVVDGLLGTGLKGPVKPAMKAVIDGINDGGHPVLAVDIPSGLCSDTGQVLGAAVRADATVTFIGRKVGQVCAEGPDYCGTLYFDDLDVPAAIYQRVLPTSSC